MIIDIHTHVYPVKVAARAIETLETSAAPYGIKAVSDGTLNSLKESMKENDIDCSVILPIATRAEQVESINNWSAERHNPEEGIIFFGTLHPDFGDFEKEIERIAGFGFRGVKFHGEFQQFSVDDKKMMPVYKAISDAGLCLMMHSGEEFLTECEHRATPKMISKIVESVSELKVIAAHGGGFRMWDEFLEYLAGNPNVWVDLSFIPGYLPDETKDKIFEKHSIERIMFGSDFPWMSQEKVLKYIRKFGLSEEKEKAVLGENAAKLLMISKNDKSKN